MNKAFIWFDLGYTLVYQPREKIFQQFLREKGIQMSLEQLERAYHSTDKKFMREYPGALSKEKATFMPWYNGELNYKLGLHFDLHKQNERIQEIQQQHDQYWLPFPYTKFVLEKLKKDSFGIGIISNWDASAKTVLADSELIHYFDHVVISSEIGVEKPAKEIFLRALQMAGTSPEECLYVGDNYYDDVIGSSRAGIDAVLINRFGTYGIEELTYEPVLCSIEELPQLIHVVRGE